MFSKCQSLIFHYQACEIPSESFKVQAVLHPTFVNRKTGKTQAKSGGRGNPNDIDNRRASHMINNCKMMIIFKVSL